MVEEILQWLKNISIFLIFMTTVLNLIPEKEDTAAPNSASMIAWSRTSASECPKSPFS